MIMIVNNCNRIFCIFFNKLDLKSWLLFLQEQKRYFSSTNIQLRLDIINMIQLIKLDED